MCYTLRYLYHRDSTVPCGTCPDCRNKHISGWSIRLQWEEKRSCSAYFITLSYDDDSLKKSPNGLPTLWKSDIQKFFKRVRKVHEGIEPSVMRPNVDIRYFAVGEYGGKFGRPHYHVILFNVLLDKMFSKDDRGLLEYTDFDGKTHVYCKQWRNYVKVGRTKRTFKFEDRGSMGHVTVGKFHGGSVGYALKYITKEKDDKIGWKLHDDRVCEFSCNSRGLGANYLESKLPAWHKEDLHNRMYVTLSDGLIATMPRYYKERIYTIEERCRISRVMDARIAFDPGRKLEMSYNERKQAVAAAFRNQKRKLEKRSL